MIGAAENCLASSVFTGFTSISSARFRYFTVIFETLPMQQFINFFSIE
jgi:hypothetical protein